LLLFKGLKGLFVYPFFSGDLFKLVALGDPNILIRIIGAGQVSHSDLTAYVLFDSSDFIILTDNMDLVI